EMLGVLGNPAQALSRVRAVIDDVATEGDCVPGSLSLNHSFQGRPVAVDVGEDEQLHRAPSRGRQFRLGRRSSLLDRRRHSRVPKAFDGKSRNTYLNPLLDI